MGQTLPLFCLFSFFSQCKDKYTTIRMCDYKWKKRRWCAWYSNPGRHMEGANKSTELWRLPPPGYCTFLWANPGLFFVYFWSFQTKITIFTTKICEKCPSSIRCWDLNPLPSECESLPKTTRPGLPPRILHFVFKL